MLCFLCDHASCEIHFLHLQGSASHPFSRCQIFFPRSITNETGYKPNDHNAHPSYKTPTPPTAMCPSMPPPRELTADQIPMVNRSSYSQMGRTALTTFRFPATVSDYPLDSEATIEFEESEEARPSMSVSMPNEPAGDLRGASTTYLNSQSILFQNNNRKPTPSPTPVNPVLPEPNQPSSHLHPYVRIFTVCRPHDEPAESCVF